MYMAQNRTIKKAKNFSTVLSTQFIYFCEKNDLEKVRACLTLELDVNTVSETGLWSGLTIAAYKNYLELLDVLLSHPAIPTS